MTQTLIVIDGNSLMHRAFYALPNMKTTGGVPTGALYGFVNMLDHLVREYSPTHLAAAFDMKGGTFRHGFFDEYKAGRRPTPPELISQLADIRSLLAAMGVAVLEREKYEADDILGSLARAGEACGMSVYLVTGDRDALQLVSPQTRVIMTKKGVTDTVVYDEALLRETYGIAPPQIVDLKALMGDASDNIPGVPGVGEKTALKLLAEYGTLDALYSSIDALPRNKLREKLETNEELARLSYKLATIYRELPVSPADCAFSGFDPAGAEQKLTELEFGSILKRMGFGGGAPELSAVPAADDAALEAIKSAKRIAVYPTDDGAVVASEAAEWRFSRGESLTALLTADRLPEALRSPAAKVAYDSKALMHIAGGLENVEFDVETAAYVLDPSRKSYALDKLRSPADSGFASALFTIAERQKRQIEEKGLSRVMYEIEAPLTRVLYEMECEGFRVDKAALSALSEGYARRIQRLTDEIYALTDEVFNIASTKQLGQVLFEKLGLPAGKKTKTGWSTDAAVLERLVGEHPVIEKILEYRTVTKLDSTYAKGLLAIAGGGDRIHTTFRQTVTATGRISSVEPNLQNIPVKTEEGREIRRVFIPSSADNILISADYSQIELRVLAHISGDEHMTDAFRSGEDIHTRTASQVFHVPPELVSPYMRSSAKAVNFGIVYGISDFGLARNLGIPIYEAASYIKNYLQNFSGVDAYMKQTVEQAKQDGFVRTLFGRIRYIDELKSPNRNIRQFGERVAMNTPIQGTAADIIKAAMIAVSRELSERRLKSKLILQVHDELIVDALRAEADEVSELLRRCMEGACRLSVPLVADVKTGENWAEAK